MHKFLSLILILALASSLSLGCALAETPKREYAEIDWYFFDNNLNSEATGIVDDTLNVDANRSMTIKGNLTEQVDTGQDVTV